MTAFAEKIYTKKIENTTFTISASLGLSHVSFILVSGSATWIGGTANGVVSEALDMHLNAEIELDATGQNLVLEDITITATNGTVYLTGRF